MQVFAARFAVYSRCRPHLASNASELLPLHPAEARRPPRPPASGLHGYSACARLLWNPARSFRATASGMHVHFVMRDAGERWRDASTLAGSPHRGSPGALRAVARAQRNARAFPAPAPEVPGPVVQGRRGSAACTPARPHGRRVHSTPVHCRRDGPECQRLSPVRSSLQVIGCHLLRCTLFAQRARALR